MSFDTERLIIEVKARKSLWDVSSEDYSNRDFKKIKWEEITAIMCPENSSVSEIREFGRSLRLKWRNVRTSFSRELRRRAGAKSGSAATRKSPYVFFNQLQFLKETITNNTSQTSLMNEEAEESENDDPVEESPIQYKRIKKSAEDNTRNDLLSLLKKSVDMKGEREMILNFDSHKMFLLSLIDDFKKIPENRLLDTKMEIINVIKRAQSFPMDAEYSADLSNYHQIRSTNCFIADQENLDCPNVRRSYWTQGDYQQQPLNSGIVPSENLVSLRQNNTLPIEYSQSSDVLSPSSSDTETSQESELLDLF